MKKTGLFLAACVLAAALAGCAAQEPAASLPGYPGGTPLGTSSGTAAAWPAATDSGQDTTESGAGTLQTTAPSETGKGRPSSQSGTRKPASTATRVQPGASKKGDVVQVAAPTPPTYAPTTTQTVREQMVTNAKPPATPPPDEVKPEKPVNSALKPITSEQYYGAGLLKKLGQTALLTAYNRLAAAVQEMKADPIYLEDLNLTREQFETAFTYYRADFPQHFWRGNEYELFATLKDGKKIISSVKLAYSLTASERTAAQKKLESAMADILKDITGNMSVYDRELAIHDWMVEHIAYDSSLKKPYIYDIYGALVNRVAVCEGYARAFQYLLYQAGVPCLFVTGDSKGVPHAWNAVQLDGQYYYVDVTWDDPLISGISEKTKPILYAYFNITETQLRTDHTLGKDNYPLPACTATKYQYYTVNGSRVGAYKAEEAAALIKKAAAANQNPIRLYTTADPAVYITNLGNDWTNVCRLSGVNRGVQFSCIGRELFLTLQ